ncbi:MAG: HAMP domain-containing histidine kinase [Clostridiales bacterium]|nr:HAMP domain-containing histidine kinase [Clostridiales bacterium]
MFKKLKIKFILTTMILMTSIVLIILGIIYGSAKKNNENMLFSQMNNPNGFMDIEPENNNQKKQYNEGIFVIYNLASNDLKYTTSYDIEESKITELVKNAISSNKERGFIKSDDEKYAYNIKATPQIIQILLKDSSIYDEAMTKLNITSIIILIISIGLMFIVSLLLARNAIKPVEAAYNSQKQFIADASHELKTPLAIIKTNLDIIEENKEDYIKNQNKWLQYISMQTERMSNLVNNLLFLAKIDNNENIGIESEFDLSDTIIKQILAFEAVLYENSLELKCNIKENIKIKGDKESINQLIGILVDNAIKHAYKNTEIVISLYENKQKIILTVQNKGENISEEDAEKIFERFYRVDKSRDREKGGYGLGLAIAKSIVEKFKGKIMAESLNNVTTFKVEFPTVHKSNVKYM